MENQGQDASRQSFNIGTHGLRGIASVMVFMAHLLGGTIEHIYESNAGYVETMLPFWNFGTFGVDLFFLISGFVILPSAIRYSVREFALRRFWRLYPLFLTFSVVFICLNAAINVEPTTNNWQAILSALTFMNIWTHTFQLTANAWSLTFEVWFYMMTAVGVVVVVRRPSTIGRLALLLGIAAFLSRYPIAFWFLGGIVVRLLYDRYNFLKRPHPAMEVIFFGLTIYLASRGHYDYRWSDFANPVVPMLIVATTCYFAFSVSNQSITSRLLSNRVTMYLGTVSYSLYLLHPYTYVVVRKSFEYLGLFGPNILVSDLLFFTAAALVTFPATHVVHRILERGPYEAVFSEHVFGTGGKGAFWRRRAGSTPAMDGAGSAKVSPAVAPQTAMLRQHIATPGQSG
jgi:peptidoglycan/LPS O-acetylase OafA/YrhL